MSGFRGSRLHDAIVNRYKKSSGPLALKERNKEGARSPWWFVSRPEARLTFRPAIGGTPEDLQAFIASEVAKWGPIIKSAGMAG